ncbi:hypothetical protein L1887_10260 [Cichorium endivia]|nr:hypothetical protein L1887_10260 [Cichorium endivia]
MASSTLKRWLRPEVYPLFAAMGVALGICGMQLVRNISGNPEVRVTKENRAAGILDNFVEGEKYAEHRLRKFVRNKSPEIMPSVNSFFTDPKYYNDLELGRAEGLKKAQKRPTTDVQDGLVLTQRP